MIRPRHGAAAAHALALLVATAPAAACWDGYHAKARRVTIDGPGDRESVPTAEVARWLVRIDALLDGDPLEASFGFATMGDDELHYRTDDLASLFDAVAEETGANASRRASARARSASLYVIQLAAGGDETGARRVAQRANESRAATHGFLEIGGFPADNPRARVVIEPDARGRRLFKVHTGTFLDLAEARRVARELAAELGGTPWVRPL
jgi:hypothetical protein